MRAEGCTRTAGRVSSTIIGARRLTQLEDNVGSIDVRLTPEELGGLDALTKPTLGFPQNMQPIFPRHSQRRHERERRLRGSLRFRDGEGQHALLSCPRSRRKFGARRGLSCWENSSVMVGDGRPGRLCWRYAECEIAVFLA